MIIDARDLTQLSHLVRGVDTVQGGRLLRVRTEFLYPDGSSIDVFVPTESDGPVTLSDMGQTMSTLLDMQVKPWLSKKRAVLLDDAIEPYGVSQSGAEFRLSVDDPTKVPIGIVRLGQACLRASDLMFTRRSSLQNAFVEDVEEVLSDGELAYEPNVDVEAKEGHLVKVDFRVSGRRSTSLILGLAANSSSQSHAASNEVFRKLFDLSARSEQRVTVFDDRRGDIYKEEDIERLKNFSVVLPITEPRQIIELLAA